MYVKRTRKGMGLVCHSACGTASSNSLPQAFQMFVNGSEQLTGLICVFWFLSLYCCTDEFKLCDIGLIKSLLAAKLLWGCELKVDAAHNRGSAYSVVLKKIHYSCTESNLLNPILSELPSHQNSLTNAFANGVTGAYCLNFAVTPWLPAKAASYPWLYTEQYGKPYLFPQYTIPPDLTAQM